VKRPTRARLLSSASQALLLSLLVAPLARAENDAAAATGADSESAPSVSELVVTGARQTAQIEVGPLGARSILETPLSVARVDPEQLTRIAATTIDAAFKYDASLRSNNSGLASGNTFSSRGLAVDLTFGYRYDGLAFPYWYQDQPIESLQEIQVLKGAGGFVYGYASPGGVVNFVSKKPTDEFQASANLSYRSSSIVREHIDVGGPLVEGGTTGFRLNVVNEQGTLYNHAYNKNQFVTLWLQGDITPQLSWSADGFYQRTWQTRQSNNISFAPGVTYLKPVDGSDFNLGAPSSTKFNDVAQLTGRLNYQINDNWKASLALRYSALDERFRGNGAQILNNKGDYQLGLLNQNRLFHYYVGQFNIEGKFSTGPIEHSIVAGLDYLDDNFDYDHQTYTATGLPTTSYAFGLRGNIYSGSTPDWAGNPAAIAYFRPPDYYRYQEIRERGAYVSDTLKLDRAELMLGLRYTSYKESDDNPVARDQYYKENSPTPVVALSYEVADQTRVYASYVEALQRGGIAPDTALNQGASFGPLKSHQYEVGIKAQHSNWNATLAAFRTSIPSERSLAPVPGQTLGLFVRDGQSKYEGLEFDGNLQATPEWLLNLSIAYLDSTLTKSATPSLVGTSLPGTVDFRAAVFAEYAPHYIPGLKVFGGARYSGKSHGQADNSYLFPSVTVGDVGASYQLPTERNIEVRANLQNVTNKKYWVPNAGGTGLSAGEPRTYSVSIAFATGGGSHGGASGGVQPWGEGWYVGLEGGGAKASNESYDIVSLLNPSLGTTANGLRAEHDAGWEVAGAIGRDFGLFRGEFETSYDRISLKQVTLRSTHIPVDTSGRPAGTYGDPGGSTSVLALLANGLVDLGGGAKSDWAFEAGGGAGLARVNSAKWRLQDGVNPFFQGDNDTGFAWQALARVRRKVTDHIDATLTYRFLNVTGLKLHTSNANELKGDLGVQSLRAGLTYNF
jgi:iron complex outermembrane receptor protein